MLNTKNREVLSFWNTITLMGFLQKSTGKKNRQTKNKSKGQLKDTRRQEIVYGKVF